MPPAVVSVTPTAPTAGPGATVCVPAASSGGGPISDPNGPYFHQVAVARTDDGITLSESRILLDHASVPDGVRLADGSVRIYYVNGADGGVWTASLANGTLAPIGPITINGVARPQGVVDPDASLVGGRIRLAYLAGLGPTTTTRAMCLAESADGINFTYLATAFTVAAGDALTDPSITVLRSGTWLMAMSNGTRTVLARSADGLSFAEFARVSFGGVPEVTTTADGRVRLYVCAQGIDSYVSSDEGANWLRERTVVSGSATGSRIVCDPSMVAGTNQFVYKVAP